MTPDDEHPEQRRRSAPVFAVAPVTARHRLPRGALVAVVVGVAAFVTGFAVQDVG